MHLRRIEQKSGTVLRAHVEESLFRTKAFVTFSGAVRIVAGQKRVFPTDPLEIDGTRWETRLSEWFALLIRRRKTND